MPGTRTADLPLMTPLTEIDVNVNAKVATSLGLPPPQSATTVTRGGD